MPKPKKALTPAQKRARKAARAKRREQFEWVLINGKQVKIRKPPTVEGMDVDDFIRANADPLWLHQHEMWELIDSPGTDPMDDEN